MNILYPKYIRNLIVKYVVLLTNVVYQALYVHARNEHMKEWRAASGLNHSKAFSSTRVDCRVKLLNLSRSQIKHLIGALTGHFGTNEHLHRMRLSTVDTCRFCEGEKESMQHILCGCDALARRRLSHLGLAYPTPDDYVQLQAGAIVAYLRELFDTSASEETRSSDEVRTIIKTAKLHESELTEVTQILRFPDASNQNDNLRLMLLDDNLLKEIESGNNLMFKGDPDENVVLCTSNKTYDVKEAETSNSLLLIPELLFAASTGLDETIANNSMESDSDTSFDKSNTSLNKSTESDEGTKPPRKIEHKDIVNTFFTYYELKPCKPRLSKLSKLLEHSKFQGLELEYAVDKSKLLSYDAILEKVQASKAEIDEELEKIQAVHIDGYYRLLDFDYEFRVLSYMLDLIDENSWALDRISKEETMESLKEVVPPSILEPMFRFYTTESILEENVQYYQYKQDKVCRFLARVLLKSAGKFNLAEFLQAWRDSVPEGMVTDESLLSGIALVDKTTTPQVVWGFAESDLPEDIIERFKVLFQTKTKWTVDQISPYIECYATEKLKVNALLTKYARASTQDGVRVFSAKHMN